MTHDNNALAQELEILARNADQTDSDIRYYSGGSKENASAEALAKKCRDNLPAILSALRQPAPASGEVGDALRKINRAANARLVSDIECMSAITEKTLTEIRDTAADMLERLAGAGEQKKTPYPDDGGLGEQVRPLGASFDGFKMIREHLGIAQPAPASGEVGEAVEDMRRTARELRENANGDCSAVMQAIKWEERAGTLERLTAQPTQQPGDQVERVARAIARANGDEFANAFKSKARWTAKRGMSGGRFRDVNEPFQSDYLEMARAALAAMPLPTPPAQGEG